MRRQDFVDTPACDVVYFAEIPPRYLYKNDLTVRVGSKEAEDPIPVCYCFGKTERMILDDVLAHGRSTIFEEITAHVKADECACEVKNPAGRCSLGNVTKAIQKAQRSVGGDRCVQCHRPLKGLLVFRLGGEERCLLCAMQFRPMLRRSALTAAVASATIVVIDRAPALFVGDVPPALVWQIPLTYAVLFCAAVWGPSAPAERGKYRLILSPVPSRPARHEVGRRAEGTFFLTGCINATDHP